MIGIGYGRTQHDKNSEYVTPEDFGAASSFSLSIDDTAAVQAALDTGKRVHLLRLYRCTGGITSTGQLVTGQGTQTGLVFDGIGASVDGLTFTPEKAEVTSGVSDCAIYVRGTNGGVAIRTKKAAAQYSTYRSKFHFSRLLIAGYEKPASGNNAFETTTGWTVGIQVGDAFNVEIYEVDGYSTYRSDTDPSGQLQSAFIKLDAESAMLTAHIGSITCSNWYRAFEVGDRCFFQLSRFDFAHTYQGIYQTGTTVFGESKISNGNINAQHRGIYFANIGTREISGVVIRRHRYGWKSASYDWHGISLDTCNYIWITDCQIAPDESYGAFNGVHYGVHLASCGGVSINGIIVSPGLDRGVLASNCTMVMINQVQTFQNESTDIVVRWINNTRQSYLGFVTKVSTFIGTEYSNDGTTNDNNILGRNISLERTTPFQWWRETDQGVDGKNWYDAVTGGVRARSVRNDSDAGTVNYELITRSGTTISSIEWRATLLKLNGTTTETGTLQPSTDNTKTLGAASARWSTVYAGTGTINTSDAREKTDLVQIDDAVLDAWGDVSLITFRWLQSIQEKGDEAARWHFGVIAQQVRDAFIARGLDGTKYGLLCYDEWNAKSEVIDDDGNVVQSAIEAGNRWGIRAGS
jgi:hypothetical protein